MAPQAAGRVEAQAQDPKTTFTDALARFSLALDGQYGDEGPTARLSLEALDRTRQQWDALIRNYESGMAADLGRATPDEAVRMHMALGGVYLDRNRVEDAIRELSEAVRLDPRRTDALTLLGLARSQLTGRHMEAVADLRQATTLVPEDPVRAYQFAREALELPDQQEAAAKGLERFLTTRAASGDHRPMPTPFIHLGLVQEVEGLEPFFPPALFADGFALLRQGRYEEGISRFKTATVLDPLFTPAATDLEPLRRAGAALRDGATGPAIEVLTAAIARAPATAELHRVLGLACLAAEQVERGLGELRDAIRLNPSDERARLNLAGALFDRGDFEGSARALMDALAVTPDSGRARHQLARVYQRQGDYEKAVQELERAAALAPLLGLNSIQHTLGALHRSQQNYDGAIGAFSTRAALIPNSPSAHQDLGDMYFRQGRHTESLAEYSVALLLDPGRTDAYAGLAQVYLREGRFDDAATAARRAIDTDRDHKEARYLLATALQRLGRADEGTRELQIYQRLQADATALQSRRLELAGYRRDATVRMNNGQFAQAVDFLRKALAGDPDNAASHLDLGVALLKAGETSEALTQLNAAASAGAPADVHRHLADAYAARGQLEPSARERALYAKARQEALRRAGAEP